MAKPHPHILQVRCCCQPGKVLGYLPVPGPKPPAEGVECVFQLQPPPEQRARRTADPLPRWSEMSPAFEYPIGRVKLVIARFGVAGFWRLAFKAEGVPLGALKRIDGFIEA